MRCACIDVGSNTTRLLVADPSAEGLTAVRNERSFTLIGRSLGEGRRIPQAKLEETASAVAAQAAAARELGAERLRVVATAAIRRAANAEELAAAVRARTGLALEVLAGEEEARLAFRGAARTARGEGTLAVVDVGGGSTEIAWGEARSGRVEGARSLAIGSSTLAERHLGTGSPPSDPALSAVRDEVREALGAWSAPEVERAVAVGGSASSLERLVGDCLGRDGLAAALDALRLATVEEISTRFDLAEERVRLLPAGLIVLDELSARLGRPLRVCKGGLREGVVLEMLGNPA